MSVKEQEQTHTNEVAEQNCLFIGLIVLALYHLHLAMNTSNFGNLYMWFGLFELF